MGVTSTLAVTAIQARDFARDQRREAEGLISFMLGDLKDNWSRSAGSTRSMASAAGSSRTTRSRTPRRFRTRR